MVATIVPFAFAVESEEMTADAILRPPVNQTLRPA